MPTKIDVSPHNGLTNDVKICEEDDDPLKIRWKSLPVIPKNWRKTISWLFFISVLVEASFLIVQVVKTYRTKSAKDLSLTSYIILLVTNSVWIFAAIFVLKSYAVLASGVLYVSMSILLIIAITMYS